MRLEVLDARVLRNKNSEACGIVLWSFRKSDLLNVHEEHAERCGHPTVTSSGCKAAVERLALPKQLKTDLSHDQNA